MSYRAIIRQKSSGIVREYKLDIDWKDHHDFLWTEGNYGCDCNRALFWFRANGEEATGEETLCGDGAYIVVECVLEDGTRIPIDGATCP